MTLNFVSDMTNNDRGFFGRFDAMPSANASNPSMTSCPLLSSFVNLWDVVVSPMWPNLYPNAANCEYHIDVPKGHRIELSFNYFQTEPCCDKLTVYDGNSTSDSVLKHMAGNFDQDTTVVSSGNSITMTFVSDMTNQYYGFSATYSTV